MIVINLLEVFYLKLPKLNIELRNFIVKILPILALVFGFLITFASIMDIIGTPFISVFGTQRSASVIQKLMLVSVLGIFSGILMLFSFRTLRKKEMRGWKLLFWSQLLWSISALIILSPSFILGFIFMYPLFQVKAIYR